MTSVNDLVALMSSKGGLAKPNMFQVNLPSFDGANTSELNLLCKETQLPGRQITSHERLVGNKMQKIAYGGLHTDIQFSFYVMNDWGIKKYFEAWQAAAYDHQLYQVKYKSDYARQINVSALKRGVDIPIFTVSADLDIGPINVLDASASLGITTDEHIKYTVSLYDAWPTTVNAIPLTNEQNGIVEIQVDFTYSKWTSNFF